MQDPYSVAGQLALSKKQGVSGQSVSPSAPTATQKYSKDFRTKALIKEAIMDNDFLKNLSSGQVLLFSEFLRFLIFQKRFWPSEYSYQQFSFF
jgi:hypothetical protein